MNTAQAVEYFGGKKKLAEALGISPSAVTFWGELIPMLRQFQIQLLTHGALSADEGESAPALNKFSSKTDARACGPDGAVISSSG